MLNDWSFGTRFKRHHRCPNASPHTSYLFDLLKSARATKARERLSIIACITSPSMGANPRNEASKWKGAQYSRAHPAVNRNFYAVTHHSTTAQIQARARPSTNSLIWDQCPQIQARCIERSASGVGPLRHVGRRQRDQPPSLIHTLANARLPTDNTRRSPALSSSARSVTFC